MEPGDLRLKLDSPVLDWLVALPQGPRGDLLRQVELEDFIRFGFEAVGFAPQGVEEIDLGLHRLVCLREGARDLSNSRASCSSVAAAVFSKAAWAGAKRVWQTVSTAASMSVGMS